MLSTDGGNLPLAEGVVGGHVAVMRVSRANSIIAPRAWRARRFAKPFSAPIVGPIFWRLMSLYLGQKMTGHPNLQTVYFFVHVPKCAGTTVEFHFRTALGDGYLHAPRWKNILRNVIGNCYSFSADDPRLAGVRVASGHSLTHNLARHFPGREIEECVLIREPLSYFVSFYNYRVQRFLDRTGPKPTSFERWYQAQRRNPMVRFLLNRYYDFGIAKLYGLSSHGRLCYLEERLSDFLFVGGHHRANEMIDGVSRMVGVPTQVESKNVSKRPVVKPENLPASLVSRIKRENALDTLLFERWSERGWRDKAPSLQSPVTKEVLSSFDQLHFVRSDMATGTNKYIQKISQQFSA
jgi:hypothetical protein